MACWCLDSLFNPVWRELEDEYVAFNRASGDTHRFDAISANLLIRLQQGSATLPALVEYVADALAYEPDSELTSHVEELLLELERNRFVSPGIE